MRICRIESKSVNLQQFLCWNSYECDFIEFVCANLWCYHNGTELFRRVTLDNVQAYNNCSTTGKGTTHEEFVYLDNIRVY